RRRVTLLIGGAVAVAIVLASLLGYLAVRGQLRSEIDGSLRQRMAIVAFRAEQTGVLSNFRPGSEPGDPDAFFQPISPAGRGMQTLDEADRLALPVSATSLRVAAGRQPTTLYDDHANP